MNNVFEIKRFGKYLSYDLRNLKNNYLLSLVVIGLIPVISYLTFVFFKFLLRDPDANYIGCRIFVLSLAFLIAELSAPVKLYGSITQKKAGSNWLMIPASGFEKFLSMLVITCVVLPLGLCAFLFCSDTIMSLCFPQGYGEYLVNEIAEARPILESNLSIKLNIPAILVFSWCQGILMFTLGAIVFKRAKIGKTILCSFAMGLIASAVMTQILPINACDWTNLDPSSLSEQFNNISCVSYTIVLTLLVAGLFFRIRTIKH